MQTYITPMDQIDHEHAERDESGIVGYWKFNKGNGTTVTDHSGNGNHGTLTNDSFGDDGGAAFASGVPTWDSSPFSNS